MAFLAALIFLSVAALSLLFCEKRTSHEEKEEEWEEYP